MFREKMTAAAVLIAITLSAKAAACNSIVYANPSVSSSDPTVRSTLGIAFTGTYGNSTRTELCTAELMDDVPGDMTPLVILANHCLPTGTSPGMSLTATTYWDVDGAYGPNPPDTRQISQFVPSRTYQVTVLAIHEDSALLQLSAPPPQNARFSAWSAGALPQANDSVSNINHSGFYQSQAISGTWTGTLAQGLPSPYQTATQYRINDTSGYGYEGSSGSGYYEAGSVLVAIQNSGDLCSTENATALATSFAGDGTSTGSFSYWLDPKSTGTQSAVGRDAPYSSSTPKLDGASASGGTPVSVGTSGGGAFGLTTLAFLTLAAALRRKMARCGIVRR